jgi:hypothetical protein
MDRKSLRNDMEESTASGPSAVIAESRFRIAIEVEIRPVWPLGAGITVQTVCAGNAEGWDNR